MPGYRFNFSPVFANFDHLLLGAWVTVYLSVGAVAIGLVISLSCAIAKNAGPAALRRAIDIYIEIIRNTPFLAQIYFIYFALPQFGLRMAPNVAALVALVVNVCAFATEIIRAGIESVGKGQMEAGIALGLRRARIYRHVVLKPALRNIYPALTSQFIYLMLSTSVVSVISATDLAAAGNDIQQQTFTAFEVYLVVTAIYLVLTMAFAGLFALGRRVLLDWPVGSGGGA